MRWPPPATCGACEMSRPADVRDHPRTYRVVSLPGDGIGPEVTRAATRVLDHTARAFGLRVEVEEHPVGWSAVKSHGSPLPPETLDVCGRADAVFLGAVGDPEADGSEPELRPESGLLALRRHLGCHTNLRPVRVPDALVDVSPLRPERVRGTDLVIVRELAGGLYYGEPRDREGEGEGRRARDTLPYSAPEVQRIAHAAFSLAKARRGLVTSVDKANILATSRLWREVVSEVAREHPDVRCEHMLVDRAAMELVLHPTRLDVILTSNLFGDILSDEAAGVAGSLGLLPSASVGGMVPLFEPVHGSAPDLAGQGTANPAGAILSVALMFRHALRHPAAALAVERAVDAAFEAGCRTRDLARPDEPSLATEAFTSEVVARIAVEANQDLQPHPLDGRS